MLRSIFLLDSAGDLITSRKYRIGNHSESDFNFALPGELLRSIASRSPFQSVMPVYFEEETCNAFLIVARDGVFFVAHTDPDRESVDFLLTMSVLETMYSVMRKYFGAPLTESLIRSKFDVVCKFLDEMIEGGFPFSLELNNLESTAVGPSAQGLMEKLVSVVSSASSASVSNSLTGVSPEVWWRRGGVSHSSNECYVEVVDKINCIVSPSGRVISGSISGSITVNCRLSGLPDLLVSFKNPGIFDKDNISFHPSVRTTRWEREKKLSFTPPDGHFVLCDYTIFDQSKAVVPFTLQSRLDFDAQCGNLSMAVVPRLTVLEPKESGRFGKNLPKTSRVIDSLSIKIRVPNVVSSATLFTHSGSTIFDPPTGLILWNIGQVKPDAAAIKLEGTLQYKGGPRDGLLAKEFKASLSAQFSVKGWAASGVKIDALEISCVEYTPYKGCRYTTKAGSLDLRL